MYLPLMLEIIQWTKIHIYILDNLRFFFLSCILHTSTWLTFFLGHISFRSRASVIPGGSNEIIDRELKSVEEHVLTPVPSAYELEAIRLVEAKEDEMIRQEEMKLAETLLQRLLADLNDKKLERDEIVKLTEYCVEVVQRKDYQKAVENDVETKDLNEYQVSGIADKLVKFTLEHLLDDIKSGGVSHEDLTKLTVSVVGNKKYTDDYPDKQIDQFAENTLQDITEEEPRSGSPENEIILNEFIVKTIKTLADDVERGRLSKEIIEDMLSLLTAEMGDHLTQEAAEEISLKSVLHKIIADLENDKSESLYRVVHAFVSSYLNYRESSQESLEDLVKTVIERARAVVSTDQDAIESLSKLAEEMSSQSLSSAQISSIANEVIKATSPEERSLSEVARTIVEEAISSAREIVMQATPSDLSTIASSLTTSINSVLHEPTTEVLKREDPFTNSVAMFVTDVLNVVFKNMEKGYFTETDICDMMNSVKTILHTRDDKDKILADHIKCILSDVSSGEMNDTELQNVGQELIHCGRRLLGKPSKQSRMTPSFTSTAIADDVTGHLFQSLQELFQKGEISKEALKELTQCILRSGSSVSLTASGKLHGKSSTESLLAKLSTTKYPSPCDSRIAEEVVRCTVDQIKRDIDDGKLSKFSMISMASSAISLFSGVENRSHDLNTLLNSILDKLREEKLTIKEVKALFRAIVRKYQYDLDVMFTDRELTSADSQLAETLIRETITKIDRDIRSGNITNEDMMLFADETKRSGKETPSDVINLVLSVIQHLKRQVIDNMADENLMRFLEVVDAEHSNEIKEGSGITKSVDLIWCDIALNRHSSIYLKRILENYVTQQGTEGQIMVLGDIMQTMNIGVLSHFVKMTVAEVLSDIRKQRIQSGGVTVDTALSETGRLIQTASSIVANKLVQNLLNRIEKTVLIGKSLSSDQELVPLHSESRHGGQTFANFENELLMRISSNEIGGHILETLNNIISNMRLERSIDRFHHLAGDDAHKRMSSGVIEDFVLETLQDIVESMQDHLSLNELQDTQQMLTDASKTSIFVMDAVNNILKEMSEEIKAEEQQRKQETSMSVERDTSTASLEAEAVVVGTLHTIIQDFIGDEDTTQITVSNFKFDKEPKTGTVIGTLQSLKRDIGTPNNAAVRDAVTDIIQSTVEDGKQKEDDNFIEDTIDMIIHTLERNKLKPNDSPRRYSNSSLETDDTLELLVVPADGSDTIVLDGRALSLQKMAEMTSKMLKLYEENPVSPYHSGQELVGHISTEKVAELISEAVSKTLSNIETGILSEKEIHDLANVLSEIFPVETLEESGQSSDHQKASAFDEKSVENFVMAALEKAKQELVCGSLDEEKIIMAVQSITHVHRHGSDTQTSKRSSLTSMSSEMLTKLVKSVLSNIANAFSNEDLAICDDTKKKQGSTKSMSSQTSASSFSSSSTKKGNVNPNATNRLLSAHSSEYVEHQKKTTPVPTLQSFCDVTNTRTCYVNGFAQQKTHDFYEETLGNKKPTCMVAPQKAIPKTPKKNKRNVNVGSTYVGRRDVRRDSPLPVSRHTTQNRASVTHETPANQRQHRSNDGANNNPARSITRPILHPNTQAQQLPPERAVSVQNRPTPSIGSTREITSKRRSVSSMNSSETTSPNMKNQATASKKTTQTRPNTLSKSIVSGAKESAQLRSLMPDKVVKVPLRTSKISGDKHTPKSQKQGSVKSKTNTESPLKSEPAEVRSLCGSHKTKITVRRNSDGDNDQLDLRSSHFN